MRHDMERHVRLGSVADHPAKKQLRLPLQADSLDNLILTAAAAAAVCNAL